MAMDPYDLKLSHEKEIVLLLELYWDNPKLEFILEIVWSNPREAESMVLDKAAEKQAAEEAAEKQKAYAEKWVKVQATVNRALGERAEAEKAELRRLDQ